MTTIQTGICISPCTPPTLSMDYTRGVIASRSYSIGEIISREKPLAFVISPECRRTHCHHCLSECPTLLTCSLCYAISFCSIKCQKNAWKNYHQKECSTSPQNVKNSDNSSDSLLQLFHRSVQDSSSKDINELCYFPQQSSRFLQTIVERILSKETSILKGWTKDDVNNRLARFEANNFVITDSLAFEIGHGIYLKGSMMNHTCLPNCVLFYEPNFHVQLVRCIRPIAAGEECTIAYVDVANPNRQEELLSKYHFQCTCRSCSSPFLEIAKQLPVLSKQLTTFLYGHTCQIQRALTVALEIGRIYVLIYQTKVCPFSPIVGLHYYTIGDIHAILKNEKKANEAWKKAYDILSITSGKDAALVMTLVDRLGKYM